MTRGTVLVVDDDDDIRSTLHDLLTDEGYEVVCAANGREALDRLRELAVPCLVLLDLYMPVMSGRDFYAALQADPNLAHIPVVVSTSDPSKSPPGLPVLRKPVDPNLLLQLVAKHCPR